MAKFYTFLFQEEDGSEIEQKADKKTVSGTELMDIVGVPHDVGLVWLKRDGTQQFIGAEDEFTFKGPGRRLKKAPVFKRGLKDG